MTSPAPANPRHDNDEGAGELSSAAIELAPGVVVHAGDGTVAFAFAKSSGPGGQNVNKRSTKTELRVVLERLPIHPEARLRLAHAARGYMTDAGQILIVADEHRSQGQNRAACLARFRTLLVAAIARPKLRRPTRPTRGSKERRLASKKAAGQRKRDRSGGTGGSRGTGGDA